MKNWLILILGLLFINAICTDILLARLWKNSSVAETKIITETKYIYPTISPTIAPTLAILSPSEKASKPSALTKSRQTLFIPIPGSGSTDNNTWQDLPGTEFNFNTSDYPNLVSAYLEINMRLFNGNGAAFVRLFDISAGIEVWGSEVKTSSQSFTALTSEKLTLREGNHLYRIQARSLTADTAVYNSGRIRLITEN